MALAHHLDDGDRGVSTATRSPCAFAPRDARSSGRQAGSSTSCRRAQQLTPGQLHAWRITTADRHLRTRSTSATRVLSSKRTGSSASRSKPVNASVLSARAVVASRPSSNCCCAFTTHNRACVLLGDHPLCPISAQQHITSQLAVVSQDAYLFHGTVRDNLRSLPSPIAARQQMLAASRTALRPRIHRTTAATATTQPSESGACGSQAASANASPLRGRYLKTRRYWYSMKRCQQSMRATKRGFWSALERCDAQSHDDRYRSSLIQRPPLRHDPRARPKARSSKAARMPSSSAARDVIGS